MTAYLALCRLDEIAETGSKGMFVKDECFVGDLFIVRKADQAFVYRNSCPHTGIPLEWQPDQFLDLDKTHIQCSTHFALFDIESGKCISGPCVGLALEPLPSIVEDGEIRLVCRDR